MYIGSSPIFYFFELVDFNMLLVPTGSVCSTHLFSKGVHVVYYSSVCCDIFLILLCGILRLHVARERLTKSNINRILDFCSQSRFQMLSYSPSATQIGYRACGERESN